ncbi:MAG: MFS transporter, partial [Burkholderiales bacterium]
MSGAARALAIVLLGTVVAPLDSAVNAAFPAITAAFALEVAAIQWLVIAYMVAFSSLVIVSGRVADLFGHRRAFGWGLAVSALAFLGCGLAPGYGWLLAARVLQGVGIALILGAGPALALGVYPASERTRVLSLYAAAFAIGLAAGPALGGLLVDALGWRAVYLARVPLALAALLLLANVPPTQIRPGRAFDIAGALLLATWTGSLMLALSLRGAIGVALCAAAATTLALFVAREAHAVEPTIRVGLFRDAAFTVPNLASVAVHFAGFGVFLLGPYFFVRITGLSAQGAGLLLALGPAAAVLGSVLA